MKTICVMGLFAFLVLATRADVFDRFIVLDGTNGFCASPDVPQAAIDALKKAQNENKEIDSFSFTSTGDWVLLENNGVEAGSKEVPGYQHFSERTKDVAFSASGPHIILYRGGGFWGPGSAAWLKVKNLLGGGHEVRSVSFVSRGDGFVVLYDKTGVSYSDVPTELAKVLDDAVSGNVPIQCVALSGNNWVCLSHDKCWASDANLPAARIIDQEFKNGKHPKWVALVPQLAPFDPQKFVTLFREAMVGKIAGGYECVVIDHGKIAATLADGWARAPWEKVDPAVKMTVNTRMQLASVSKTITAVAMLRLCEECTGTSHQFSLDEPFWPHIRNICPAANEQVKRITIRQVLQHRSGFINDFGNSPSALRELLALQPAHSPGTFSKYENINYYIVRLVIEQISRMDYATYVKMHVFSPMGITDMDTCYHDKPSICCYAKPGQQNFGADENVRDWAANAGPGGWVGSAMDVAQFLEGVRQCKVLSPVITAMMFQQNLGWDWGSPSGPWGKGGLAPRANGNRFCTGILYCPDDVEIATLANCDVNTEEIPVPVWRGAR